MSRSAPDPDWLTPAHKFFLSTFLLRRTASELPIMLGPEWRKALGADPIKVTERLQEEGLIVRSSLADHLCRFTTDELKSLLSERQLPVSGLKDELIQRLMQTDKEDMWQIVTEWRVLECSEQGREIVARYLDALDNKSVDSLSRSFQIPKDTLRALLLLVAGAAIEGIIGNRSDAGFMKLINAVSPNTDRQGGPASIAEPGQFPQGYVPFQELVFCSNKLVDCDVPIGHNRNALLLVGQGVHPEVWLSTSVNKDLDEWRYVVYCNSTLANVVITLTTNATVVSLYDATIILRVKKESAQKAEVIEADFRPLGLNIYGNQDGLHIGSNELSHCEVVGAGIAIGF